MQRGQLSYVELAKQIKAAKALGDTAEIARLEFTDTAYNCGTDPVTEENAILSIGRELLPPFAVAVLDKSGPATAEYWEWLREQCLQAQAEHDAENAR